MNAPVLVSSVKPKISAETLCHRVETGVIDPKAMVEHFGSWSTRI